ncbi:putative nucleotide-binding sugar-metabolising enzyme [Murinocardiopsis flavida]|uniref:Putative nucleotide-binding sugar-metabolising enzyme n=1 Tax=Murinocardiopsis flavida TaxID=645275 RepID=A0A2P8CJ85_9ACTN|nr:four-carbon acid sugar kinase family protein [Murinocardiopsis flavida]PSK85025.1 putative nucleotide-binding sugar-metabolising enzyme [Murinocardiopsis flavida]
MTQLGCIADDFTGATDLAAALTGAGYRTLVAIGTPPDAAPDADAVVVALKTRTAPVADAVRESVDAVRRLRALGVSRYYLKYCSTFDSTPEGNIGPVADALLAELRTPLGVVVPSSPANGRRVFQAHLFVHDTPLGESPMRHHPLTPMTDSSVVRLLRPQTASEVHHIPLETVREPAALAAALAALHCTAEAAPHGESGTSPHSDSGTSPHSAAGTAPHADADTAPHSAAGTAPFGDTNTSAHAAAGTAQRSAAPALAVIDAIDAGDLDRIAAAVPEGTLLTGGAGLAAALRPPEAPVPAAPVALPQGRRLVIAGSASAATREQVALAAGEMPSVQVDRAALAADLLGEAARLVGFAITSWESSDQPVLVYATAHLDDLEPPPAAAAHPESTTPASADAPAHPDRTGTASADTPAHPDRTAPAPAPADTPAHPDRTGTAARIEECLARVAAAAVGAGARRLVVAGGETSGAVTSALGVQRLDIGPAIAPGVVWAGAETADGTPIALALKSGNFGGPHMFIDAWKAIS